MELVDTLDLKSNDLTVVRVQVPSRVQSLTAKSLLIGLIDRLFCFKVPTDFQQIVLFLIQSCKDKECEPTSVNPSIHLVTTVGSFWLYDWYSIDSLGNEKILRTDSTYIAGDTVINGKTNIIKKHDGFNNHRVKNLRKHFIQ